MIRWLGPAVLYLAFTIAITYPLLQAFGSAFPHDAGDPVLNAWILWWSTRAMPYTTAWWNAPMFFPMSGAMALSELLVGLLPMTAPVQWLTGNPVAAYNAAFVLSFPLCAAAAAALAHEITSRRDVSMVAGLAFGFAPYRMEQLSHLQMLAYYWAPVALLALHRFVRTRRPAWIGLFAVAWLLQALSNGYALFHLSILLILWVVWFVRPLRAAAPIAIASVCAAIPLLPLLLVYRRVHEQLHLMRDINEIERFGADISGFLAAPRDLALWGSRLAEALPETAVFPGATILAAGVVGTALAARTRSLKGEWTVSTFATALAAAIVALAAAAVALSTIVVGPWSIGRLLSVTEFHKPFSIAVLAALVAAAQHPVVRRAWRQRSVLGFYLLATVAMYVLALGPAPTFLGRPVLYEPPYAWLMRLPGFDVLRVPARFAMLAVLCQSVVLAVMLARLAAGWRRVAMVAAVCAGLLADGWIRLPVATAAKAPPPWSDVAAVVEIPPGDVDVDFASIFRSMSHGRPIVNGYSGYAPPHYLPLVHAIRDGRFEALEELASLGPIGVSVDRSRPDAVVTAAALQAMPGVGAGLQTDGWTTFVLPIHARSPTRTGAALPVHSLRANRHNEDLNRLEDGRVVTAWGSGEEQRGGEEIVADLGAPHEIGAIVLGMGAFAFGHPRDLRIEMSSDGLAWREEWRGPTAVQTVRAALADPGVVPLTIVVQPVTARFVRLTQTAREAGIPWWVAELQIRAPAR
ncbi:MAG: hypothetical protein GEU82_13720 [Luteitalea sp.]|nr:hypothetical protein [Luteitalea sp.]